MGQVNRCKLINQFKNYNKQQYRFSISAHEAFIIMFILNRLKGHKLVTQIHLGELRKIGLGMSFDFESKESVNGISRAYHSKLH